jgi:hypothetical protein
MNKYFLLISILLFSYVCIYSNEIPDNVSTNETLQNNVNFNFNYNQTDGLFSKDRVIDFKKKQSTNDLPDDIKKEYYKYINMGVFGIVLLSIGGFGTITGGFLFIIETVFMTIFSYSSFYVYFHLY